MDLLLEADPSKGLITIVGNYINNKIMINKGGSSSYENK